MLSLVSESQFYAIILYIALAVCYLPEWIGAFVQRPEKGAVKRDRGSHFLLLCCMIVGVVLAFYAVNLRPPAATITWNQPLFFWVGIALMIAGTLFRWYAIRVLGKYFTRDVATRAGQQVIEHGPYRWIRHPSYSGSLLTIFGFGLAMTNWLSLLLVLACAFIGFGYRVRVEERALCQDLGDAYRRYMGRTWRFVPFVW